MNLKNFKKLKLIHRNKLWLTSPLSIKDKVLFYPAAAIAFCRSIMGKNRKLRYLGVNFHYDNFYTPLSLQAYPEEIQRLLQNSDGKLKNILDIGGNVGQFSVTLSKLIPEAKIDVFEPNPQIFPVLKLNTKHNKKIKLYNYGIGPNKAMRLNYVEGRSATGSFFQENATENNEDVRSVPVKLTSNIDSLTKRSAYDLIKIDVEGYEYNVLEYLRNLETRYLFIEISGPGRYKNYKHSQILHRIRNVFGDFDLTYISEMSATDNTCEMLVSLKSGKE